MHHRNEIGDLPYETEIVRNQEAGQGMGCFEVKKEIQDLGLRR